MCCSWNDAIKMKNDSKSKQFCQIKVGVRTSLEIKKGRGPFPVSGKEFLNLFATCHNHNQR